MPKRRRKNEAAAPFKEVQTRPDILEILRRQREVAAADAARDIPKPNDNFSQKKPLKGFVYDPTQDRYFPKKMGPSDAVARVQGRVIKAVNSATGAVGQDRDRPSAGLLDILRGRETSGRKGVTK